jgi:hypothetical protein
MLDDFRQNGLISDSNLKRIYELYDRFRDRIKEENQLINCRTNWFIAMQSVFVLSISIFSGNLSGLQLNLLTSILAFAGWAVCLTTFISVRAAQVSIRDNLDDWEQIIRTYPNLQLPRLAGSTPGKRSILRGGTSSICIPIAFAIVWAAIMLAVWIFETPLTQFSELVESLRQSIDQNAAVPAQPDPGPAAP